MMQTSPGQSMGIQDNVLKPVPQPPLEPELDLNKASGTKLFWGRPCHVDAQHGPKQEAGVQGGGTAPEASDDLYLLQPIVQWKMLFLHSVEHSTLCN